MHVDKLFLTKIKRIFRSTLGYGLFTLLFVCIAKVSVVNATLINTFTFVTTQPEVAIPINLTNNISNITNPVVTIFSVPSHGTAVASCVSGIILCITYTPEPGFIGFDTFQYSVVNDLGNPETATITVKVGDPNVIEEGLVSTTEVGNTLVELCASADPLLDSICNDFNTVTQGATPEDLRVLLEPLSPSEVAAQGTIGSVLASEQLANIGKHLAALRKGQSIASAGGLVFNHQGKTIRGDLLAGLINRETLGGAASADANQRRWGWFVNGNIGGGDQDESDFENGFEFESNGISAGADYRFGADGVLGVAVGFAATSLDIDQDQGGLDAAGRSFIGYGSLYPSQNSYIDIIVSGNLTTFDSERRIEFGSSNEIAFSSNDSLTVAMAVAAGFNVIQQGGFTAMLDLKGEYIQSTIDGYSESGNSPYNISIAERNVNRMTTSLGGAMTYAISTRNMVLLPQLDLHWVHQFEEQADIIEAYFNIDPNQTTFRFNSNLPDTDYFSLELGLSAISPTGVTGFFQLGSTISRSDYQNWRAAFGLRMEL